MKSKLFITYLFVTITIFTFSQEVKQLYFLDLGFGYSSTSWKSSITNGVLYDKSGFVLKSGDLKFSSKNIAKSFNANILFPVSTIRMGFGLSFEEALLDRASIKNTSNNLNEESNIAFEETINFQKMYLLSEVPILKKEEQKWELVFKGSLGYFTQSSVESISFFGLGEKAKRMNGSLGVLFYKTIIPNFNVFINPCIDFKYFKESFYVSDTQSTINHNILSYFIIGGIRIEIPEIPNTNN